MTTLGNDTRPISALFGPGPLDGCFQHEVGKNKVTKIEPYEEPGGLGPVLWFSVWQREHLASRVNSMHVESVAYNKEAAP